MRRIFLAVRAFFLILANRQTAQRVTRALPPPNPTDPEPSEPGAEPAPKKPKPKNKTPQPKPTTRSDALTLLAALQREARLLDFVNEPLDGYTDAQVGAAARDVHRDCTKVLDRLFALRPAIEQAEGEPVDIPPGFDTARYRLSGNLAGDPPFHGRLVHHGWEATRCELPSWSGTDAVARIVAPAEVELK